MSITIRFTEQDKQRVRDRHGDAVADRLIKLVDQKNETLQWKSTVEQCRPRFYSILHKHGEYFAEMFFNAGHKEYRAILAYVPDYETFSFRRVIEKEDHYQSSRQHEVLEQIHQHPHQLIEQARCEIDSED